MAATIAIAVVRRGREFLVGRRTPGAPLAGMLEFPGGKARNGESPGGAARRECLEETGLAVEVLGELARVRHCYAHGELELHFLECTATTDQTPRAPFNWVDVAELRAEEFPAANVALIAQLIARYA